MKVTQQEILYTAERCLPLSMRGTPFSSQAEIRAWVTATMNTDWWGERFPHITEVEVHDVRHHGDSLGTYYDSGIGAIEMSRSHWSPMYVCHELAHVITLPLGSASHDPLFVAVYLELVYRCLGADSWRNLRRQFLDAGVCFDERDNDRPGCTCGKRFDPDPLFAGTFSEQRKLSPTNC